MRGTGMGGSSSMPSSEERRVSKEKLRLEVMNSSEYQDFFIKHVKMPEGTEYPMPYMSFGLVTHKVIVEELKHVGDDLFTFPIEYQGETVEISGQVLFRQK